MAEPVFCGSIQCFFDDSGMIHELRLPEEFDFARLLTGMTFQLSLTGNRKLHPIPGTTGPECWHSQAGSDIIEFSGLHFASSDGRIEPGFRLTLRYELFPDGTAFTDAFLLGESASREIDGLELNIPLDFHAFQTVRWALSYRPKKTDGALIQTSAPERNLPSGTDRVIEHSIFPLAGFNLWSANGPSCYAEFFMEGDNVLAGDPSCTRSSVIWENGNPVLSWNFQTSPVLPESGPWQWRNRWGWVIAPAARTRRLPPLVMYHYFDNTLRYPSDEALEAIAQAGADVLILHENWRTDVQNGGQPYDPVRFREVVDYAHRHDIRIMVYIRGNEDSVVEEKADWFEHWLKRNYDGLYMDYGGPFHDQTQPDDSFQGGRIRFRRHYLENLARRRIVGPDGLFFSHTGPLFSALGMTGNNIDGYVSGEGERGLLIRSRLDHDYFSMAQVCPGTMWTAAFPEYSERDMIPLLAATGQSPHVPLGVQFPSSSLAHPPVPGIGDLNFRPLWKLFRLMRGERDLKILNDYNCRGIFSPSEGIAHYLMISDRKAMCLIANFSDRTISTDAGTNWREAGIDFAQQAFLFLPSVHSPGRAIPYHGEPFVLERGAVGAVVFGMTDLSDYERPYPVLSQAGEEYLRHVEHQRKVRQGFGGAPEWFIRITVPDLPVPYESSMIADLYNNCLELNELTSEGYRKLGYLSRFGFQREETRKEDFVINGTASEWIGLRNILGPGKKHLAAVTDEP